LPVEVRQSYGAQLSVLKKAIIWISIVTVILLNASVFGVYSYFAEYLKAVTNMSQNSITLTLFIFGGANIIGNIIAGKLLTYSPVKSVLYFPMLLSAVYIIFFFTGKFPLSMALLTLIWGILAGGLMANINQFLISSAAPEAPDFANGLFISACNVGTTVGSAAGGLIISAMGTQYVVLVGILAVVLSLVTIVLRNYMVTPVQQLSR
jgi:predicted MFS family arabinose efflux permease